MMCLSAWCVCVNVQTEIDFMWILFIPFSQDSSSSSSDSEDDKKKKKKKKKDKKKKKKKKVFPVFLNFQVNNVFYFCVKTHLLKRFLCVNYIFSFHRTPAPRLLIALLLHPLLTVRMTRWKKRRRKRTRTRKRKRRRYCPSVLIFKWLIFLFHLCLKVH